LLRVQRCVPKFWTPLCRARRAPPRRQRQSRDSRRAYIASRPFSLPSRFREIALWQIFIVLELVTGGELFDKIVAEQKLDEANARNYFRQLMKGLKYCHSQNVCHRDLKPENLLLDANGLLKISDFGLSAMYTGSDTDEGRATLLHTTCGTPNYVAPEVLADKGYDGRAADIWSAGVILFVLMAGYLPFDEPHMSKLFAKIQKAEFSYPAWFSAPAKALISQILVPDPLKRLTLPNIEANPWFIGPDNYHDDNNPFSHGIPPPSATQAAAEAHAAGAAAAASAAAGAARASPAAGASGGKQLQHVPSAKDIEDAVGSLDDGHVVEEASPAPGAGLPPVLNAFDLVNMLGGMELGRMMEVAGGGAAGAGAGAAGGDRRPAAPQFLSSAPVATLLSRLSASLKAIDAIVTVDEVGHSVTGRLVTGRGEISMTCTVYRIGDGAMHLVEIRRGRGDVLEFQNLAKKVRDSTADLAATVSKA
jgi:hypothetical protein